MIRSAIEVRKLLTTVASFIIMLCIGGIYAWSIIASELIEKCGFSASQTQLIFGVLIAIFPITMIFTGRLSKKIKHKYFGYISGLFFLLGYLLASYSQGNFILVFAGIGILTGIATGFGYWVSLTSPVQLFPERKGLITGIAAAGFGLGAVFMSEVSEFLLNRGYSVLELLKKVGLTYGLIILVLSNFIYQTQKTSSNNEEQLKISQILKSIIFRKLFLGIFLGTFAGLLIIGNLRIIGGQFGISNHNLILGVSFFAVANFLGRISWGFLSDYLGASLSIFIALFLQSTSIITLNLIPLTDTWYLILSTLIGFGFGGNFVLFAKETAQIFGVKNLGIIYPYVFLGYAIAGITGPFSGGILYDFSGSYYYAIILASLMSLTGSLLFFIHYIKSRKNKHFN